MSIDKEIERKKKDEEPLTDEGIVNITYRRLRKFRTTNTVNISMCNNVRVINFHTPSNV